MMQNPFSLHFIVPLENQTRAPEFVLALILLSLRGFSIQNLCKGKTVIVVAHRLSALKMCNRVAVVENHTITSVGTHEEVRKNNAYYRKAWDDYETARNITYQLEGGEQHE